MLQFKSILAAYINDFIHYRKASMNWNATYERYLYYFDHYCHQNYPNAIELTQEMVNTWCTKRETEVNASRNTRINIVIYFIQYLQVRHKINITEPIPLKSDNRKYQPHAFSHLELKNFFYSCDTFSSNTKTKSQYIRKLTVPVFFRLLYSTGIRPVEARLLKVEDIDIERGILNIRKGKGHNQHFVVVHDSTLELLKKYEKAIEKYTPRREYFFTSIQNSYYSKCWVSSNFKEMWTRYNDCADVRPYDLRHHYAITNINKWIGEGFDFYDKLLYLSKSMGHSSLDSTTYYYSLVPSLTTIIEEKTRKGFDDIVPEVEDEKQGDLL